MIGATFYKWRAKYGGMYVSLMKQMKELENENRRLKRMYAEERIKAEIRKEALEGKLKGISATRDGERRGKSVRLNVRLACERLGISETCYHCQPKLSDENAEIADWLIRLTHWQRNWEFGLCFLYLRNVKGYGWNHKRVYRIYCELELNLRIKP
jgi:putative transposase